MKRSKCRDNLGIQKLTSGVTLDKSLSLRTQVFVTWNNNLDFSENPLSSLSKPACKKILSQKPKYSL